MTAPFILRFQEAVFDVEAFGSIAGTRTHTCVRAEQIDADPEARRCVLFGQASASGDTCTEESDEGRAHFSLIPAKTAGTQTRTKIRAEGIDPDPESGGRQFRAFP